MSNNANQSSTSIGELTFSDSSVTSTDLRDQSVRGMANGGGFLESCAVSVKTPQQVCSTWNQWNSRSTARNAKTNKRRILKPRTIPDSMVRSQATKESYTEYLGRRQNENKETLPQADHAGMLDKLNTMAMILNEDMC